MDFDGTAEKKTNLITPEGYRRLTDELNQLLRQERPRIVEEVQAAVKQGDRSENAEYQYGKRRLRQIDSRVRFLTKRIEAARVVDPREQRPDCVRFGCTVVVENEDGRRKTYQLVGEDESDLTRGRISWKSPVGRGLLKARVGDAVEIEAPGGPMELVVIEIKCI